INKKSSSTDELVINLYSPEGSKLLSEKLGERSFICQIDEKVNIAGTYKLTVAASKAFYTVDIDKQFKVVECPSVVYGEYEGFFYVPTDVKDFEVYFRGTGARSQCGAIDIEYDNKIIASGVLKEGSNEKLTLRVNAAESGIWKFRFKDIQGKSSGSRHLSFSKNIPPYISFNRNSLMRIKKYSQNEIYMRYQNIFDKLKNDIDSLSSAGPLQNYWQAELTKIYNKTIVDASENDLSTEQENTSEDILFLDKLLDAYKDGRLNLEKCAVYNVKAITNRRILPDTKNINGEITNEFLIVATPGEYEPASFVIKAFENIKSLCLEIGDLRAAGNNIIPANSIDLKSVKCWYQDMGDWLEKTPAKTWTPQNKTEKRELVPELLLNDDSFIQVDTEKKHNYANLDFEDGTQEVLCISDKNGILPYNCDEFPIKDSKNLLPVDIPSGQNKQFWLTVHVPEVAQEGIYESTIKVSTEGRVLGNLLLKLKVLPFKLDKPCFYVSGIFLSPPSERFYNTREKVLEQYRKELDNLRKHGVYSPIMTLRDDDLPISIKHLESVGENKIFIRGPVKWLYYYSNPKRKPGDPISEEFFEKFTSEVEETLKILREKGIKDVYFYGFDERWGTALIEQRPGWEAIRKLGGKIYVTGSPNDVNRPPGNFQAMGDIQDMMIAGGYPQKGEAAKWHSKGHKIVVYANPGLSAEIPETYRRNYGLLLWQYDYDGPMSYLYHFGRGVSHWLENGKKKYGLNFPATYNDFEEHDTKKQFNMVYPTIDGVIDTVQWEGYREGIDDVRYLTTLLNIIKKHEGSHKKNVQDALVAAKTYLKELKETDINLSNRDMDTIRLEILVHILDIMKEEKK
ncbi:MAG: hypothetical protein WCR27_08755, partial [Eubacteriales bacterium]